MTSTAGRISMLLAALLALACGGSTPEPGPPPQPPWETAWSAEHGAELGPHLERFVSLKPAFEQVKDLRGDVQIQAPGGPGRLSETVMLLSEPALLDPSVASGQQPTISLDAETNPRLDQLKALQEGAPVSSFFSQQRAGHLLSELQATHTVVILALHEVKEPEVLDARSFAPGRIEGTAHVFDYASAAYLGRAEFSATNSPEVSSFSDNFSQLSLSLDLHHNTQRALGQALNAVFPTLSTPEPPEMPW